ncbi:MAG: hypothetical protein WC782_04160 [Methylococcaceae bacterium]
MKFFCLSVVCLLLISPLNAGTLVNNEWKPKNCGTKPNIPKIDDTSVLAFNQSISLLKDWQEQATAYYGCIVEEGNADNSTIANTANQAQQEYQKTTAAINEAVNTAKQKLDHR